MNLKISVIIPVYNVEKYLSQCVESVLSQTYKDFEVILVDDGSPDGSSAVCDKYAQKDSRVKVIHQDNAGVSVARNNGIDHAEGEWVTFIDSDDWIEPDYLANFDIDNAGGIDLVIQGLEYYDQRIEKSYSKWSFKPCTLTEQNFRLGFAENRLMEVGFPIGKAYRKKLLSLHGLRFDTRISFHEDHIFVLDYYMLCHTIRLVDATNYKYRCYHTGTSLSSKRHSWERMNIAGDEMLKRIEAMEGKFYEKGSDTAKRILTSSYDCKMTAAETIFLSEDKYSEKKKNFNKIIRGEQLSNCYFPDSSRSRLTKKVYLFMPFLGIYLYHKSIELLKMLK